MQISVKVTKYGDRRHLIMYYDDPVTGKRITRSTKETALKAAERAAAKWEAELREGRYRPASAITWAEFRERYESEVAPSLAERTGKIIATAFNALELVIKIERLRDVTADRLSHFQAQLREGEKSEATIRTYLAHLKAAFAWAVDVGLMLAVPKVKIPKRAKGSKLMKGRPITLEEFERMLEKIPAGLALAVRERRGQQKPRKRQRSEKAKASDQDRHEAYVAAAGPRWERLLWGLWLSGLRLGEAINLSWDDERCIMVDFSGRRPRLRILAEHEKGKRDRLLPITPDFAAFLEKTPEAERKGPVFPIGGAARLEWASSVIVAIGKAANVLVDKESQKFASAHDLRRSFGKRWSERVMPTLLQQLMRHSSMETTLKYYVGQNADSTADAVWKAWESSKQEASTLSSTVG